MDRPPYGGLFYVGNINPVSIARSDSNRATTSSLLNVTPDQRAGALGVAPGLRGGAGKFFTFTTLPLPAHGLSDHTTLPLTLHLNTGVSACATPDNNKTSRKNDFIGFCNEVLNFDIIARFIIFPVVILRLQSSKCSRCASRRNSTRKSG